MSENNFHTSFHCYIQGLSLESVEIYSQNPTSYVINNKFLLCLTENNCRKLNIETSTEFKTIIIREDEWFFKSDIIKSRLNSLFGKTIKIHGRATKITKITKPEISIFLEQNHLNTPTIGKFNYGLRHKDELVSVITFSKSCPIDRGEKRVSSHILLRFSHKQNHTVIGGFSKLLQHFIKEQNPQDIVSFVDKEWSDGESYLQFGFKKFEDTEPICFYIDPKTNVRYTKNQLTVDNCCDFLEIENKGNVKLVLERY